MLKRQQADMDVTFVTRVEGPAQDANPKTGYRMAPANIGEKCQGRTCPAPRTTYLNVVSCSTPTGPRA